MQSFFAQKSRFPAKSKCTGNSAEHTQYSIDHVRLRNLYCFAIQHCQNKEYCIKRNTQYRAPYERPIRYAPPQHSATDPAWKYIKQDQSHTDDFCGQSEFIRHIRPKQKPSCRKRGRKHSHRNKSSDMIWFSFYILFILCMIHVLFI